ncbi:hypothetical protein FKR81_14470 [Lentzea tibetensis]|uniref:Rv3660c-like CheY-like N-terminal domain-containing protein n=1 Tax=Lentzea tibetensis TaxID=2591470 RepID=A0A563EV96_9PSEU|nr:septum site-determining protein Ssd [Lentzea tibetensis]TWP51421.1 hypothetical protein FKR81_14470 [Lentzea tibetensis]
MTPTALLADTTLLDDLLRLMAAADCDLVRVPDVSALRPLWHTAPLVLLDAHGVRACLSAELPRRSGVFVVHGGDPPWDESVRLGVERVLELPLEDRALVTALTDVREGPPVETGRVLAVLGGRGGAGASVLAASIARAVAASESEGLLVDCDPLGGGIDLTLGAEEASGARWPAVQVSGGRIQLSALRTALPARGKLTVLSCDRDGPGPEPQAVAAVLDAGRRGGCTVVCDLPRHPTPPADTALGRADLAVLVVPAEVRATPAPQSRAAPGPTRPRGGRRSPGGLGGPRPAPPATAAAKRVADRVHTLAANLRLVVRGPAPGGLRADQVAEVVGIPLLTQMRPEPGLAAALDRGAFPNSNHGPLAAAARAILKELNA